MIASIFTLDTKALRTLGSIDDYTIHRLVYDIFPGKERTFLYYQYPYTIRGGTRILILSKEQPKVPNLGTITSKQVPASFLERDYYGFKVRLNPVIRSRNQARSIIGKEELISWFLSKQEQWGFYTDSARLELSSIGVTEIQKGDNTLIFNECTFSGILHVEEKSLFIKSFTEGIGRGKGFGFGLLQLQPINKIIF